MKDQFWDRLYLVSIHIAAKTWSHRFDDFRGAEASH